jgi:DTW domain-containing protein YfiP
VPVADAPAALVDNRIFALVLQHPQEKRQALATAPLLTSSLRQAAVAVGLSWPNLAAALGRRADPALWAVAYLGSARPAQLPPGREVVALDRRGQPLADQQAALAGVAGIVLIDGTWKEAKTLWWRNPWLLRLRRLVLNPKRPSRYARLRREPRREALSTLEAAALALGALGERPEAVAALAAALDRLLAAATPPVSS